MANKEDDEITKVLDLNTLDLGSDNEDKLELFLLNYKTQYFKNNIKYFEKFFIINNVETLDELDKLVTQFPRMHLGLFYNEQPKIINALLKQLNQHYPLVNSIVFAENLSSEKVELHKKQDFNAKHYFDTTNDLGYLAQNLNNKN